MKNLSRLFQCGSISLNKYIESLSSFVGESATKQKKKCNDIDGIVTDKEDVNRKAFSWISSI